MPALRRGKRPVVVSLTSSAAIDAQPQLLDDLTWKNAKYDKRQAYCVSKACCVLFSDHLGALGADDTADSGVVFPRLKTGSLLPAGLCCRSSLFLFVADRRADCALSPYPWRPLLSARRGSGTRSRQGEDSRRGPGPDRVRHRPVRAATTRQATREHECGANRAPSPAAW
jgi:hypothetical protein